MTKEEISKAELQSRLEKAITSYSPEDMAAALEAGADPTWRIFKNQIEPLAYVCGLLGEEQRRPVLEEPAAAERREKVVKALEEIITVLEEHLSVQLSRAIADNNIVRVGVVLHAGANPLMLIGGETTPLEYARHALDEMENGRLLQEHATTNPGFARKRENAIKDLKEIIILLDTRAELARTELPAGSDKMRILTMNARDRCNGAPPKDKKVPQPPGKV